ncbi:Conjugal transfer protein traG [Moraxella lacunata]|uniref:Conjugal transfer protein traG n=1 Tax=Moraxella lacunata TaxID=477 RepID=A0A378UBX5_MORLA|nr:Conjugal transfer protein traG [Moraxella lacunata]
MWIILNVAVLVALFAKTKRELHGSARFANDMEIRKTGFLPTPKEEEKLKKKFPSEPPVIIGKHKGKFLQFYGNEFISIGAPTRSGKGVSIVIPNLLTYPDSIVVLDIKMENWLLTAGFRAKYQDVFLFAPKSEDGRSHRYNPLDYIDRDDTKRMADVQNIANIFYPADDPKDAFWQNQAQRIFTGLVLYMMETPNRPCSMAELIKLTTPTSMPLHEWIPTIINERKNTPIVINNETGETRVKELSVECIEAMMAYVNVDSDNTRSSILATLMSPLNVFTDPSVATATSHSDFRLDDVRKKKMTIYVGIQPNELSRFSKLLNVFFSQLININTRVLPEHDERLKYQCLVLLDEFTSLGRVDIIQKSIAYIAGYNVRLMPIFQSVSQVEDAYGKDGANAILSNIACQVEFTPTTIEQAEHLSKRLGTQTIKSKSISRNRGKGGGGSVSTSDQSRALMLPQELKEMDAEKEIIFFTRRTLPIFCDKAFYYTSPDVFGKRMKRVEEPAQGLDIPAKHQPPILDIKETLKVMRGVKLEPPKNHKETKPIEHYQEKHPDFLAELGKALGFTDDVFAELDRIETEARAKQNENSMSADDDEIVFNLDDKDEFDNDFVQEQIDDDEFNF